MAWSRLNQTMRAADSEQKQGSIRRRYARVALIVATLLAFSASPTRALPPPCAAIAASEPLLRAVDKARALPGGYEPDTLVVLALYNVPVMGNRDLRLDYTAAVAYERLVAAARTEGHELIAVSGYRSFDQQRYTFYRWMLFEIEHAAEAGEPIDEGTAQARANRYSALPGHSEHQLGTALDVSTREIDLELSGTFALTDAGRWLAAHAHEYGFVTSYPEGKEALTGFKAEPWHMRFVGAQLAGALHALDYRDPGNAVTVNDFLAAQSASACTEPRERPRPERFE